MHLPCRSLATPISKKQVLMLRYQSTITLTKRLKLHVYEQTQ